MNSYLNSFFPDKMRLFEFVITFDHAVDRLRNGTAEAASYIENTSVVPSTDLKAFEKYATKVYIRNVFNIMHKQIVRQGLYYEKSAIKSLDKILSQKVR